MVEACWLFGWAGGVFVGFDGDGVSFVAVFRRLTAASPDLRATQAYAFMLGNTSAPDFRNTQSYFQTLQEGTDALRDTFTYFYMLGNIAPEFACAFNTFFPSGQTASALAAPINPGPEAHASTFGPKGDIL